MKTGVNRRADSKSRRQVNLPPTPLYNQFLAATRLLDWNLAGRVVHDGC